MSTVKKQLTPEEKLAARKAIEAAEKAELRQALMSLYIPFTLFISCCIFAAGVFMVYYGEPAGWGFIGTTAVLALTAFIALFKFQNKFRARGIIPTKDTIVESSLVDPVIPAVVERESPKSRESKARAEEATDPLTAGPGQSAVEAAVK